MRGIVVNEVADRRLYIGESTTVFILGVQLYDAVALRCYGRNSSVGEYEPNLIRRYLLTLGVCIHQPIIAIAGILIVLSNDPVFLLNSKKRERTKTQ